MGARDNRFDGMTRRQVLRLVGATGLAATASTILPTRVSTSAQQQITINFNHTDGPTGEAAIFANQFKKLVEERSNARIAVETFHSGELGAEKDMYDSLQLGTIEMGRTGSLIISVVAPEYGALEMPYVFRSQDHLRAVMTGPIGQEMHQKFLEAKGIRVLAIVNRGPRQLTTTDREVKAPADVEGLKLRVPEIPVYVEAWQALGASPTPMAFPEVFTALQQGAIDGQENPLGTIWGNSFYDVQKYLNLTTHVRGNGWMVASEAWWQGLSEEDRQLLQAAADEAATFADGEIAKQETDLLEQLREKGMTVVEPDVQAFSDIVWEQVPPKFEDEWKEGLLQQIQEQSEATPTTS